MEDLITTYGEAKDIIRKDLESMSKKFITIGYYLKYIRDKKLYIQDGFESIWEFAQDTYGISKSTCSRWMHMNDKFSEGGNSPELRQEFASFGKSQLQEMLYLDDKQIEQAKPEMTAKEIREIRKPQNQEENLKGQIRIEDYPEILPEEVREKKKTILKKPSEQESEYLKLLAKHLIKSMYSWFLEDHTNRVMMVNKSPEEIKRKLGINHRTRYFSTERGAAHANLFDDYVQLWDEKSNYIGDYDWFYLAAAIQSMWNNIALERLRKKAAEPEEIPPEVQQETQEELQNKPVAPAQQNEEAELQQEVKEELQTEAVKMEQQTEKYEQTTEQTDIELLKEELEKAQRYLTMLSEEFTEKDIRMRKQKLIVGALAGMLAELDNEFPEPVQPPLPKLKNNDQRKEWLNNYRSWGIWYKDEHIGATYYRYQFENSAVLIVEEYENEYTGTYISSYFHLVGGTEPPRKGGIPKWTKHEKYSRYPNSETELVEFLKEIQKG